jgi:L-lactate dehydrogenase complex protein LldG
MMGSRAEILGRVHRALAKPGLEHHHVHQPEVSDIRQLFASDYTHYSLIDRFKQEFERVSGETIVCTSAERAFESIRQLVLSSGYKKVAVSKHDLCRRLKLLERLPVELPEVQFVNETIDSENALERERLTERLSEAQLSVTGVEYLIADIGTLVTISNPQASRQISLLPTAHLALATANQIYPNMAELFLQIQEKYGDNLPGSALTLITGPSRTADIEKVLIKGVHGPTRLLAVLLDCSLPETNEPSAQTRQLV